MRKLVLLSAVVTIAVVSLAIISQLFPIVGKAMSAVNRYEMARKSQDGVTMAALTNGSMVDWIETSRDHALTSSEVAIENLSPEDQLLILGMRAAVLSGQYDKLKLETLFGTALVELYHSGSTSTKNSSVTVFEAQYGLPIGAKTVRVWVGPAGFSIWTAGSLAFANSLYIDASETAEGWKVNPIALYKNSAKGNLAILGYQGGRIPNEIVTMISGYSGDPALLWQPLGKMEH